ncbi:TLD domain-containing protein KIAA1609 [Seminavis robusta]|uniref:Oxidation resistance protein 1 n=1 Tax=Seminavis robusta TaxID=568900 RepID=A0A9N8ENS7_9STRA|nr:TLD domain-containing protein KIAA1609 [Seminavis robusta]|eukprot:Sro1334_g263770.1 TLD domain-containing protein KIAA1609 (716) ;mRNA; f:7972-10217
MSTGSETPPERPAKAVTKEGILNDTDKDDEAWSLFQCCHPPKGEIDCWSALKQLLHLNGPETGTCTSGGKMKDNDNLQKDKNVESITKDEKEALLKKSDDVIVQGSLPDTSKSTISSENTSSGDIRNPSMEHPTLPPLSPGEKDRIAKVLECISQPVPPNSEEEKKESVAQQTPSALFHVAQAAAKSALEAQSGSAAQQEEEPTFDLNADDPQAAIQRLLEAGKRNESLKLRQQQHLERIEILLQECPTLLRPLEACCKALLLLESPSSQSAEDIISAVLGRSEQSKTLQFLKGDGDLEEDQQLKGIMTSCAHLGAVHAFIACRDATKQEQWKDRLKDLVDTPDDKKDPAIEALHQSLIQSHTRNLQGAHDKDPTPLLQEHFLEWHNRHVPGMLSTLPACMQTILLPSFEDEPTPENIIPSLNSIDGSGSLSPSASGTLSTWLHVIAHTLPRAQRKKAGQEWHRLYSSHSDGFNLSTLEHSLTGYHGATMILVEAFDKESSKTNQTFGAFASQPWIKQDAPEFYGDGDSFLFQLEPKFHVMRAGAADMSRQRQQWSPHYQYFYLDKNNLQNQPPTTISTNKDDSKKHESGIGLGGTRRRPRFFISSSLDHCHLGSSDATFAASVDQSATSGILLQNPFWELHSLEVWGLGGTAAMLSLQRHRSVQDAHLQKARQVDKAAFLNDFRSGLIESKMFGFREEMRNRDGGCMLDSEDGR